MLKDFIKLYRIPQWIKNLFVFVPLIFSKHLFDTAYLYTTVLGFLIFCFTSSIVYIFNDIIDVESDKLHPQKKNRPIAAGRIAIPKAISYALGFFIIILFLLRGFNIQFISALGAYLTLNIFYSFFFRNIVLLDIFSIAAGFMIRVFAGAFAIGVEISSWLILTTMFISLFLAVMKRRSELNLPENEEMNYTRKVLQFYSKNFTDQMATVAAAGVIICYALYTVAARTVSVFGTEKLIYTTPFVVFGIFRYMFLVYMNKKGENTTELLVTDPAMIINVVLYILTTTLIIY
ncbi:MAG TPA: decaprenyl-phosphate phosphoribosyltransferase [Ignavibacteriaceae bacterium]|nr:decaprenyl-phosphate phosphoribosyltransferase [Ignavibacteriaceae bacterium]